MYTQCHHCKTVFYVDLKKLSHAAGMLKCGVCATEFDGRESLSSTIPGDFQRGDDLQVSYQLDDSLTQRHTWVDEQKGKLKYAYKYRSSHLAIIAVLVILLAIQITWFTSNDSANPDIEVVTKQVISHPTDNDSLIISASLKNTSDSPKKWPIVEVVFLNRNHQKTNIRRFKSAEYLSGKHASEMPASAASQINLLIKDPGSHATNYEINLY